jgi:putative peptidoglycan lipid II flippase
MIAGGLLLASRVGIESVVVGGAIGFAVQCLLLSSVVVGHRRFTFSLDARSLNVKGFFLDFVLLVFSFLPFTILQVIDVFWAARLPDGSISYLGYASRVVISLTGLIVQGISTVLFPFFAEYIANGELVILREMILKAIKTILLFAFPIIAILTALRIPLIEIMFQRGEFDQSSTIGVARVLPFYLIGMIGVAPMNILIRGFYSLRDLRTPAKLGFVAIALYILLCGLLVNTFSYLGIGIAYAVYWNFMFILQSVMLSRRIGRFWSNADLAFVLKTAIGAIITGSAVHYSYERLVNERFGVLFGTTFSALIGIIIFLGMCMLDRGRVWMPYPWIRSQK